MLLSLFSLFNVMRKEFTQTLRDRRILFSIIAAPVLQLILFGYAVNLDVDRIPTVVCDLDRTPQSRDLVEHFFANGTFVPKHEVLDPAEAGADLQSGKAAVELIVQRGFSIRSARRDAAAVQVIVDGTDSTRAQMAINAASQFLQLRGIGSTAVSAPAAPVLVPRILFNQRLSTVIYMLPGVLASALLNVTAMMAAMGLARERETGTLEQILVTPIRPVVLLAGKSLPFILFGLIDIMAVLLFGSWIFGMPVRGSLAVIALGSFLYLFSTLGFGILLATLGSSQQQVMLGAFAFILPAALLSGFMYPIETMPAWAQPFTLLNPMRHFVEIARACLLKGAGFADLAMQLLSLAVLGTVLLGLAIARFRTRVLQP